MSDNQWVIWPKYVILNGARKVGIISHCSAKVVITDLGSVKTSDMNQFIPLSLTPLGHNPKSADPSRQIRQMALDKWGP